MPALSWAHTGPWSMWAADDCSEPQEQQLERLDRKNRARCLPLAMKWVFLLNGLQQQPAAGFELQGPVE